MKKGSILLTVGLLMISVWVFGQDDNAFRVLANKGANEVKSGDAWQPVKTGASLKKSDELKISENGYLGLVHISKGTAIELKKGGTYKVSDLAASVKDGPSVTAQYVDFVLSSNSAEAKKNRMSATGAVHRGLEDIKVLLPLNENASVFSNTVIINWEAKEGGPYVVTLKNMFEDELLKAETPETSLEVNLADPKFANESAILVEVKSKSDAKSKSEQKLIKRLSSDEQKKVKSTLDTEMGSEEKEESALNEYLLASFFEKHGLLIDAITSYEKAIKLAPDVPTYKESYEEFLFRNKIKSANK